MFTIKNIFKSLFSNQAALDNRKMKWYYTMILFVLAVFLPWIPTLTNGYKSNGGAVFASKNNYEVSTALKHVISEEDYFKTIKIQKDEAGAYSLDMSGLDNEAFYGVTDSSTENKYNWNNEINGTSDKALFKGQYADIAGSGASPYVKNPTNGTKDYYFDGIGADVTVEETKTSSTSGGTTETIKKVERRVYLELYMFPNLSRNDPDAVRYLSNFTTTVILGKDINGANHIVPHSYCFLLKDYIGVYFYPFTATTSTTASSGNYVGKLDEGFANLNAEADQTLTDYILEKGELNIEDGFAKNFVNITDASSRQYTIYATWMNILTTTIAVVACLLVSSVLIIIFFKRKSSVYRDSNFWHAINTAIGMGVTPSLLAMIFGFFMSSYMMMILIAANLIRAVFIMNRICPPAVQDTSKPVYQARS